MLAVPGGALWNEPGCQFSQEAPECARNIHDRSPPTVSPLTHTRVSPCLDLASFHTSFSPDFSHRFSSIMSEFELISACCGSVSLHSRHWHVNRKSNFFLFFVNRHMQGGPYPPQAPAPPVGYMSSTLVSDLETDIPDEDEDEEEEEEEGYEMSRPLRGMEHTPGSSMDNLDSSVTGEPHRDYSFRRHHAGLVTAGSDSNVSCGPYM